MTKHTTIELTDEQRAGEKRTDKQVAEAVMCNRNTVANVRRRFLAGGLQSTLYDKERPGRVGKLTSEVEAKLTMLACGQPPEGAARWTLRLLADKMVELGYVESISHVSVYERLKKTNCSRGG